MSIILGLSISLGSLDPLREEFVVGTFVSLDLSHPVAGAGSDRDRSLFSHTTDSIRSYKNVYPAS